MAEQLVCFVHSCHLESAGTHVLRRLLRVLHRTGCLDRLAFVQVCNIGLPLPDSIATDAGLPATAADKVRVKQATLEAGAFEHPTLKLMHSWAAAHPAAKILYVHTKGISYAGNTEAYARSTDWTNLMLYCCVQLHAACAKLLNSHCAVGCNLHAAPLLHFSGNFWWATAAHIASLDPALLRPGHKLDAEMWVLSARPPAAPPLCLHESGVNHFWVRYPPALYVGKPLLADAVTAAAAAAWDQDANEMS